MERRDLGVVNAYILNLMTHADTLRLDEYDLRDRIEKRFGHRGKHIRPQNVRKFHLEPLVKKRWLRLLPDGKYERVGELRRVKPRETLFDQFGNDPEMEPFIEAYVQDKELNRNLFGAENYEDSLTEEEYNKYVENMKE
jgi:hypothetical protein